MKLKKQLNTPKTTLLNIVALLKIYMEINEKKPGGK